jgi:hypothetical protein
MIYVVYMYGYVFLRIVYVCVLLITLKSFLVKVGLSRPTCLHFYIFRLGSGLKVACLHFYIFSGQAKLLAYLSPTEARGS